MQIKALKMRWLTGGVNYSYLVSTSTTPVKSWIIDPAEVPEVVQQLTTQEMSTITNIVNTHHHYDHADGNLGMYEYLKGKVHNKHDIQFIVGSRTPNVPLNDPNTFIVPKDGQTFKLGDDITVKAIRTPCHTQDSVCYYFFDKSTDERAVFTGDTLFTAGCGRFFEGDGAEMDAALNHALIEKVDEPQKTYVYPGHEYTKSNVKFVKKCVYTKPGDNLAFDKLVETVSAKEVTTGLFTLNDELEFNPFMRLNDPLVRKAVGDEGHKKTTSAVMDALRTMKNKN
ncbi:hypothetical protein ACO0RG_003889 [Hanseniaspora osmophila]